VSRRSYLPYAPKCLEGYSVLKNSFALTLAARSGLNTPFLKCFGLVSELSWIADRAVTYFFNRLVNSANFALARPEREGEALPHPL
jgi:hypothetical protein